MTRPRFKIRKRRGKWAVWDRSASRGPDFPRRPLFRARSHAAAHRMIDERIRMEWNRVDDGQFTFPQIERRWNR